MSDTETHSAGLLYFIPSWIFEAGDINPNSKLIYALLSGLAHGNEEKRCFPSDAYISKRLKLSESQVKRCIKELEEHGAISRISTSHPNNPFKRIRYITVNLESKKSLRRVTGEPLDKLVDEPLRRVVDEPYSNKGNSNKELLPEVPEEAPSAVVASSENQNEKARPVSKAKYLSLQKTFGKVAVDKALDYFQVEPSIKDNPFGWLKKCLEERWYDAPDRTEMKQNRVKEVQAYVETLKAKVPLKSMLKRGEAVLGKSYLDFVRIPNGNGYITFDDPKALEKINEILRKAWP